MSMATDLDLVPSSIRNLGKKYEVEARQGERGTDDEGKLFIIGGKIAIEAVEDKIVILTDKFRSGYECETCNETGVIGLCDCERSGRKGFNTVGGLCRVCLGFPENNRGKICTKCKGTGQTIIIPESTKQMPTSGVIVSAGPKCVTRKLGERVLYGGHTGHNLPFKGNVRIRIMREHEVMCLMHKVDPNATMEDFQLLDEPINNAGSL